MLISDYEIKVLGLTDEEVCDYLKDILEKFSSQLDYEERVSMVMAIKKFGQYI